MNSKGKMKGVVEWLRAYPEIGGYLKLNSVVLEAGESAVNTVQSDRSVSQFIDGTYVRQLTFAIVMVCDWSNGYDKMNAEALAWGEAFLDWVDAQFAQGNVPDLGEKATVRGIESLQDGPALSAVYQEEQLARYMFQARITYWEKE